MPRKITVVLNDGTTETHEFRLRSDGTMASDCRYDVDAVGLSVLVFDKRTFYPHTSYVRFEAQDV